MTKKVHENLGINEKKIGKLTARALEMAITSQANPEKLLELIREDEGMNEKEKLFMAFTGGNAMEICDKEFKSLEDKDEKLGDVIAELMETTEYRSDIILKVIKMKDLTLREKIVVCFNCGRIFEVLFGPTVPEPPWMKNNRFAK